MKTYAKTLAFTALLAVVTLGMTGCVKFRQVITLMPDGSGKVEFRFGLSAQALAMAQQDGQDPFADMNPDAISEEVEGIVAFSEPTTETVEGYTYYAFSAYFEDINEVSVPGMNEDETSAEYVYTRDGDSATFTVTNGMIQSMVAEYEPMPKEQADQVRAMMTGLSFEEHFVLPGAVNAVEGIDIDEDNVQLNIDLENAIDGSGLIETLDGEGTLTFVIPEVGVEAEALEAFQAEMQAAIEAWEARDQEAN